jgi:ankyrin repeat protein
MIANIFEIPLSEHARKINEIFYSKFFRKESQEKNNDYFLLIEDISYSIQHAACVAIYVRILFNFFRAKGYPEALNLTEEDIFLLQIAAFIHDVFRFDDISVDMTPNQTQHCYSYLKSYGISEGRSRYFSELVVQKKNGDFLSKIFQTSENLELLRCQEIFYVDQLEIMSILQTQHRGFLFILIDEIGQLIASQYDMEEDVVVSFQDKLILQFQKNYDPLPELKAQYEDSENCYLKICEEIDHYPLLSKYFRGTSLLTHSKSESELKNQLLQVEEEVSKPVLKKARQDNVQSAAYIDGYETGLYHIEKTSDPLNTIIAPKKYISEDDRRDFRLGYEDGHKFMAKSLTEDEPIFYALGAEKGKNEFLKSYTLETAPLGVTNFAPFGLPFKEIYLNNARAKLLAMYQKGLVLEGSYYRALLDNYYQNYIKAYNAVVKGKLPEPVIIKPLYEEELTEKQRESIRLQGVAGHKEGVESANLIIATGNQKNHLAFFRLQIQRLAKLYEEGDINWARQRSFIAKLDRKAWENRSYILRNYFYPKRIAYSNTSVEGYPNSSVMIVVYHYTCKEEAISHFIFYQLLLPNGFQLKLYDEPTKIILHIDVHNELAKLRSVDSLAKSVRWDDNIFFEKFLLSITKSPINQTEEKLRKGPHKRYTVFGHGVFERSQKISPYNLSPQAWERKKAKTSLHQSTSLILDRQRIFGYAYRNEKLVGYIFKPPKNLINRIFFKDMGTVNRPYEFDNLDDAMNYFSQKVLGAKPTMFKTLTELKHHIINDTRNHNEVLARLKWDINTSCVAIFSDTFESRCIAQFYAKLTHQRLLCQYRELNQTLPQDYQVPIIFYLPEERIDNWQIYSSLQQANDKIKAEAIFSDEASIKEAFDQHNFEFLLLLDDLEHLSYQNLPVLFWVAHAYSMNIAKVLYEQTNTCFLVAFEEYLSDILQKIWHVEKNGLSVEWRNILLDMSLRLSLKNLMKEVLTTKLVDENIANNYSNFLHLLIERGEFQLLTEILINKTIDLDQKDEEGNTLLHIVAKANHLPLAKLLLEKGANTNIINKNSETPLVGCIQRQIDNGEMIKLLLDHSNQDFDSFESEANAMRKACILLNQYAVRQILLFNRDLGRIIHMQVADKTLLHFTILSSPKTHSDHEAQIEIIRMLLEVGADTRSSYLGKTALELAQLKGLLAIAEVIEASMNQSDALPFVPN